MSASQESGKNRQPWASGPGEILRHAVGLLKQDSDTHRRLAMILIDNSVELMAKTYLGLPGRITGLTITSRELEAASVTFPALLTGLETYAADKLVGIDTGEIEWYHRLRNQLYHEGNGLTVERDKVEIYAQLANLLFKNLFGFEISEPGSTEVKRLADFLSGWVDLQREVIKTLPSPASAMLLLSPEDRGDLERLAAVRNSIIHGTADYKTTLDDNAVTRLHELTATARSVKSTGANANQILIGVSQSNLGLRIRIHTPQARGHGGRIVGGFDLVHEGTGRYARFLREYAGSTLESASDLIERVRSNGGEALSCTHLLNANELRVEQG